jgi:hypothetical protein
MPPFLHTACAALPRAATGADRREGVLLGPLDPRRHGNVQYVAHELV